MPRRTQDFAALASLPPVPKPLLQILENKALILLGEEIVKGLEIAPKVSLTAPCGFVLPFLLNDFLESLNKIGEQRSIPTLSVLRLEHGKVLDAMVAFTNSIWTDQEKEAYESCSCRQHGRPGVKRHNDLLRLVDDAYGLPRRNSHFYAIVTEVFTLFSRIPINILQSTKDTIRLEKNSKKGGKWPASMSRFIPHGAQVTVEAYTRWAQIVKHPAPIRALCVLAECCPSLGPPMAQSADLPALITSLFSDFVDSIPKLKLEELSPNRKTLGLQYETEHFYLCLREVWFSDLTEAAQIDRTLASTLASFYSTICNFLPLLDQCGFVGEQGTRTKARFVATALKIHSAISPIVPALGSLHPLLIPYSQGVIKCNIPLMSGLLLALGLLQSQPKCAHIPCTNKSTNTSFKACSACRAVRYCSKECQVADWKEHKLACEMIEWVLPFASFHYASDSTRVTDELREDLCTHIKEGNFTAEKLSVMINYVFTHRYMPRAQDIPPS